MLLPEAEGLSASGGCLSGAGSICHPAMHTLYPSFASSNVQTLYALLVSSQEHTVYIGREQSSLAGLHIGVSQNVRA